MLSLTQKRWILPSATQAMNTSHILARMLAERGINPDVAPELVSPSVFTDIEKATSRIHKAVEDNEGIGIFGDYDCDGVVDEAFDSNLVTTCGIGAALRWAKERRSPNAKCSLEPVAEIPMGPGGR